MFYGFGAFDNLMFSVVPVIVTVGFIVVFGMMIVTAARGLSEWSKNNASPVLTVEAEVVAKRTSYSTHTHHHGSGHAHHHSTSTWYYATFQVESGDRMEFGIPSAEYGYLVEGDKGRLTFQGTRYHKFERFRNGG